MSKQQIIPETQYIEKLSNLFLQAELINKEIRLVSEMVMRSCKITDMSKILSINRDTMEFYVLDQTETPPPKDKNNKQK